VVTVTLNTGTGSNCNSNCKYLVVCTILYVPMDRDPTTHITSHHSHSHHITVTCTTVRKPYPHPHPHYSHLTVTNTSSCCCSVIVVILVLVVVHGVDETVGGGAVTTIASMDDSNTSSILPAWSHSLEDPISQDDSVGVDSIYPYITTTTSSSYTTGSTPFS
jgi:hypothetical protein